MTKLKSTTSVKVKRYSETSRGKRQKFKGRLRCYHHKSFELWKECDATVMSIVKRNNRTYVFNSNMDDQPWPDWKDLISKTYPLPEVLGPLNFMDHASDKSETSDNGGTITRSEPVDQSEESEQSEDENEVLRPKIRTSIGSLYGLPTLPALDLSPDQERLAVWKGKQKSKA